MKATFAKVPVAAPALARSNSHATEPASGEGLLAISLPWTWLPSFSFQVGPAKWLPIGLPDASSNFASGAFKVHLVAAGVLVQV